MLNEYLLLLFSQYVCPITAFGNQFDISTTLRVDFSFDNKESKIIKGKNSQSWHNIENFVPFAVVAITIVVIFGVFSVALHVLRDRRANL